MVSNLSWKRITNWINEAVDTIPHSIILQYYSVTSKNIPSRGVRRTHYQFIQGAFHLQGSCTKHTGFCHALYLCLILDSSVQVIQSPDHDGRFLHENANSLSCFCCLSLDLFSLSEFDMSSRQLARRCLPCGPSSQSTLSYAFPNLSHPFQFSDFNLSFSHAPWVILTIESADSHGFPHWRRHSKCVEDIFLKVLKWCLQT